MNEKNTLLLTEFDIATGASDFQMVKAYIPYLDTQRQKNISVIIRLMELINTISFYDSLSFSPLCRECHDTDHIIKEVKQYCTEKDKEIFKMMDNFKNVNAMYNMYKNMSPDFTQAEKDSAGLIKNFLNKDQLEKYEQYKNLLNI